MTALQDPKVFTGPEADLALTRTRQAGASMARIMLYWRGVAPGGATKPPGFDAENHLDNQYNWTAFDAQLGDIVAAGLEPIVFIFIAPDWAEGSGNGVEGTVRPSPIEFGAFAKAAATRYNGTYTPPGQSQPIRVRYWQAWNEPNRNYFLTPQFVNRRPFAPAWYRSMVNRFSAAVHSVAVQPAGVPNVVVAAGLAPFGKPRNPAPMAFMRQMLCMSKIPYHRVCQATAQFDAWATHPYTCGSPSHKAFGRDDVSIGDLPEMSRLLRAAVRAGRVVSPRGVAFWVTEFSWDTKPPDREAVPLRLHARWVAEALYRMWRSGVRVATWFTLRDDPFPSHYQSGLYFYRGTSLLSDRPKTLSLRAFRFPFVAYAQRGRVFVWGRTPPEGAGLRVVVERRTPSGWRRVGARTADGSGIFSGRFQTSTRGTIRARFSTGTETILSTPFSLRRPAERLICPFGR